MSAAITSQLDVAAIVFTLFWVFFLGLIYYLQREANREGLPLDSDAPGPRDGLSGIPSPKRYKLREGHGSPDGHSFIMKPGPDGFDQPELDATPTQGHHGATLAPNGDPMGQNIGPGAWAERADHPERTLDGRDQIVPMRVGTEFGIEPDDTDPRGFRVIGADGEEAGVLSDVWCDRAEPQIRYYEVAVSMGEGEPPHKALVPVDFARVNGAREAVEVMAITSEQFKGVPALANPDCVTLLEEDKISAYYGGGMLYATPDRVEPLV